LLYFSLRFFCYFFLSTFCKFLKRKKIVHELWLTTTKTPVNTKPTNSLHTLTSCHDHHHRPAPLPDTGVRGPRQPPVVRPLWPTPSQLCSWALAAAPQRQRGGRPDPGYATTTSSTCRRRPQWARRLRCSVPTAPPAG
jgi:hypothetical protein